MSYERNITCPNCGSEYELHKIKLIMRDRDSETCDICGHVLISWNGAVMYDAKLIKKSNQETEK